MRKHLLFSLILFASIPSWGRPKDLDGILVSGTWFLHLDGMDETNARDKGLPGYEGRGILSPEGSRVAFEWREEGKRSWEGRIHELRVIDRNRRNEKTLLRSTSTIHGFAWSPDGKFIITSTAEKKMYTQYYVISPDLMQYWLISVPEKHFKGTAQASWRKDGKSIVFSGEEHNGRNGFYTMDLDGENTRFLAELPKDAGMLLSSDEKYLLYVPIWDPDIHLLNIETKESRRLWKTWAHEHLTDWSPDMQWVLYRTRPRYRDSGPWTYYARHIKTGKKVKLPVYYYVPNMTWWQRSTQRPPNCREIVLELLGPGRPLSELLEQPVEAAGGEKP